MADIWGTILSMLSPSDAEAKIAGDPEAMKILANVYTNQNPDTYLMDTYKKIITAAEKRPETVFVHGAPDMEQQTGAVGDYGGKIIKYDPQYKGNDAAGILSHELMHFLSDTSKQNISTPVQHLLMNSVLGTGTYMPYSQMRDYRPPKLMDQQSIQLKGMLGE